MASHLISSEDLDPLRNEPLRKCPLCQIDIRIKKWHFHYTKCKKNNFGIAKNMASCFYNASHIVLKDDLDDHILNCPDRGVNESEKEWISAMQSLSSWNDEMEKIAENMHHTNEHWEAETVAHSTVKEDFMTSSPVCLSRMKSVLCKAQCDMIGYACDDFNWGSSLNAQGLVNHPQLFSQINVSVPNKMSKNEANCNIQDGKRNVWIENDINTSGGTTKPIEASGAIYRNIDFQNSCTITNGSNKVCVESEPYQKTDDEYAATISNEKMRLPNCSYEICIKTNSEEVLATINEFISQLSKDEMTEINASYVKSCFKDQNLCSIEDNPEIHLIEDCVNVSSLSQEDTKRQNNINCISNDIACASVGRYIPKHECRDIESFDGGDANCIDNSLLIDVKNISPIQAEFCKEYSCMSKSQCRTPSNMNVWFGPNVSQNDVNVHPEYSFNQNKHLEFDDSPEESVIKLSPFHPINDNRKILWSKDDNSLKIEVVNQHSTNKNQSEYQNTSNNYTVHPVCSPSDRYISQIVNGAGMNNQRIFGANTKNQPFKTSPDLTVPCVSSYDFKEPDNSVSMGIEKKHFKSCHLYPKIDSNECISNTETFHNQIPNASNCHLVDGLTNSPPIQGNSQSNDDFASEMISSSYRDYAERSEMDIRSPIFPKSILKKSSFSTENYISNESFGHSLHSTYLNTSVEDQMKNFSTFHDKSDDVNGELHTRQLQKPIKKVHFALDDLDCSSNEMKCSMSTLIEPNIAKKEHFSAISSKNKDSSPSVLSRKESACPFDPENDWKPLRIAFKENGIILPKCGLGRGKARNNFKSQNTSQLMLAARMMGCRSNVDKKDGENNEDLHFNLKPVSWRELFPMPSEG